MPNSLSLVGKITLSVSFEIVETSVAVANLGSVWTTWLILQNQTVDVGHYSGKCAGLQVWKRVFHNASVILSLNSNPFLSLHGSNNIGCSKILPLERGLESHVDKTFVLTDNTGGKEGDGKVFGLIRTCWLLVEGCFNTAA